MVANISRADMSKNIDAIMEKIRASAERAGRSAADVALIGVSKFHPLEAIRTAAECGIKIFGENRVQERAEKLGRLGKPASWHMIGHLQRNKARRALELFDCVQSVDGLDLARTLQRILSEKDSAPYPIMVEINTSGEPSKEGASPDDCYELLEGIMNECPNLSLEGLMTIGPHTEDAVAIRRSFELLRTLRDGARERLGLSMPHLSMGMSGDYEMAIEEGSTMVRIGTGIFGSRHI